MTGDRGIEVAAIEVATMLDAGCWARITAVSLAGVLGADWVALIK